MPYNSKAATYAANNFSIQVPVARSIALYGNIAWKSESKGSTW